jgi:hypothetical protein
VTAARSSGVARARARRGEGDKLRDDLLDATERLMLESGDVDLVSPPPWESPYRRLT